VTPCNRPRLHPHAPSSAPILEGCQKLLLLVSLTRFHTPTVRHGSSCPGHLFPLLLFSLPSPYHLSLVSKSHSISSGFIVLPNCGLAPFRLSLSSSFRSLLRSHWLASLPALVWPNRPRWAGAARPMAISYKITVTVRRRPTAPTTKLIPIGDMRQVLLQATLMADAGANTKWKVLMSPTKTPTTTCRRAQMETIIRLTLRPLSTALKDGGSGAHHFLFRPDRRLAFRDLTAEQLLRQEEKRLAGDSQTCFVERSPPVFQLVLKAGPRERWSEATWNQMCQQLGDGLEKFPSRV
jgi:hypothetical protein